MMEPEPDTDDAESHVGYNDAEVEGTPDDGDETNEEADSDENEQEQDNTEIDNGVWAVEFGQVVSDGDVK